MSLHVSSHERAEANKKLAIIVRRRLQELEEKSVSGTAFDEVGRKVYNKLKLGRAHKVKPRAARKAITALALETEDMNEALKLLVVAGQKGGCHPFPRRREQNFRQRQGIRR